MPSTRRSRFKRGDVETSSDSDSELIDPKTVELSRPLRIFFPEEREQLAEFLQKTDDEEAEAPAKDKPKAEIVIPGVRNRKEYEAEEAGRPPFVVPPNDKYIEFPQTRDEIDMFVEYEIDDEDEDFITKLSDTEVTEQIFELIFDFLEKESFKQREYRQVKLEDTPIDETDVPCCVCNDRNYDEANMILFCDGCNLAIHQECQGLETIPLETWLCDKCQFLKEWDDAQKASGAATAPASAAAPPPSNPNKNQTNITGFFARKPSSRPGSPRKSKKAPIVEEISDDEGDGAVKRPVIKCVLCGIEEGAFTRTTTGGWIHISCGLFIPELILEEDGRINMAHLESERRKLLCGVCGKTGGCVQCTVTRCFNAYHVTCAQMNKQVVRVKEVKKNLEYQTFCPQHSLQKRNEDISEAKAQDGRVELGRFINKATRKLVMKVVGAKISKPSFKSICDYWKQKRYRRKNGRKPFIYRLQIAVEVDGAEYDAGCRIRERKKPAGTASDFEKLVLMKQVRLHLEKVRTLIELVKRREVRKLEHLRVQKHILHLLTRGQIDEGVDAEAKRNSLGNSASDSGSEDSEDSDEEDNFIWSAAAARAAVSVDSESMDVDIDVVDLSTPQPPAPKAQETPIIPSTAAGASIPNGIMPPPKEPSPRSTPQRGRSAAGRQNGDQGTSPPKSSPSRSPGQRKKAATPERQQTKLTTFFLKQSQ